ncbi:GtrA family protein [Agreia sp. Leaf210]|uniref:GtrA family protein n=1 Tax=Agreia sp. Leaf210 TaxID=1735682 RepID=UPI0009E7FD4F|nr:GtrA family protein [Agreia sp. Leaf210]
MASIDLLGFVPPRYRKLVLELVQFGMVGGVGFVVQVSVFNALRSTVFSPTVIHAGPILAMLVSTLLAIVVNWLGNRYWTFRSKRQTKIVRESVEFFAVSVVGMMIGLGCLWFSHYVLGFRSVLADNISGNVIGLVLGAAFRFVLYRFWVFNASRSLDTVSVTAPIAVVSDTATRSS